MSHKYFEKNILKKSRVYYVFYIKFAQTKNKWIIHEQMGITSFFSFEDIKKK